MTLPIISIIGISDSGKTTLLEKLLPRLKAEGVRVATLKHHAHVDRSLDVPGKDTWRHAMAGAAQVVVLSPETMAHHYYGPQNPDPRAVAERLVDIDLVLTEGFKRAGLPAIEVSRAANGSERIGDPATLLAIAADYAIADAPCPVFELDDVDGLLGVIRAEMARVRGQQGG